MGCEVLYSFSHRQVKHSEHSSKEGTARWKSSMKTRPPCASPNTFQNGHFEASRVSKNLQRVHSDFQGFPREWDQADFCPPSADQLWTDHKVDKLFLGPTAMLYSFIHKYWMTKDITRKVVMLKLALCFLDSWLMACDMTK